METKYKTDVGHIAYTPGVRLVQSSITMFALEEFLTSLIIWRHLKSSFKHFQITRRYF